MAFREVSVYQIREILRLWLRGHGYRAVARLIGADRKTVRRYVEAAEREGLHRDSDEAQLTDALIGAVIERVRPQGPGTRGRSWQVCEEHRERIRVWLERGLRVTKAHQLLERQSGESVAYRTVHRYACEELGFGGRRVTVRVDDGKPGEELQVDFGRLGLLRDGPEGRQRALWALVFTACFSRHQFVWLTFRQRLEDMLEGFEQAWEFFGGVFRVCILDNQKAVVIRADACAPQLNDRFLEYAQARGFVVDLARVRKPDDKPRVERGIGYLKESFFRGENFVDLADAQARVERWCLETAGRRIHGTTRKQPLEVFKAEEKSCLLPAPDSRYDLPLHDRVEPHDDHHVVVGYALYSVPTIYIGRKLKARADSQLVKLYWRGKLIKVHPRQPPGGRSTDPEDYPPGKAVYATRDEDSLLGQAAKAGEEVGRYAARLLDTPLPWTRMRHVYRLLGLVKRHGTDRVRAACRLSLELDVVDVTRIARMLERGLETGGPPHRPQPTHPAAVSRFVRPASDFQVARPASVEESDHEDA